MEHEIPEEAAAQEPVCSTTPKKKVSQNRNMLDGLPVAVSYTHLDVYKRQSQYLLNPGAPLRLTCGVTT